MSWHTPEMTPPDGRDVASHRPYIEAALAYSGGSHTYEDVAEMVASGRLQFWPGAHSVVITEIVASPRRKTLHFFLAGGNLAELEKMEPPLVEWGRLQGCNEVSLLGRRGWERTFLKRAGWKSSLVLFSKDI